MVRGRSKRQIVGLGGGGFSTDPDAPAGKLLDDVILAATGKRRPKVCFVGTASGDAETYAIKFYRAFAGRAETTDLNLYWKPRHPKLREFILAQDAIYVGGGSTLNMLAIWRAHGLDVVLREAWDAGVVLAGISAGMICWFESPVTDSFLDGLRPITGLGFLAGSACAHFNEPKRREQYTELVRSGLVSGHAADDGVALVFEDAALADIVSSDEQRTARAFRIEPDAVRELPTRSLQSEASA